MKKIFNLLVVVVVLMFVVLVSARADDFNWIDLNINGVDIKHYRSDVQVQIPDTYVKPKYDMRAVWITPLTGDVNVNGIAKFQSSMNTAIEVMKQYNINAMMFHVRINNDALYPSAYNPKSIYVSNIDFEIFDPIEWLIERSHEEGIEFHAWMNPYRVSTSYSYSEANPAYNRDNLLGGILNPALPVVQEFLVDTCMEFIEKYDTDAIHFDDYFYKQGADPGRSSDNKRMQVDTFIENLSVSMKAYNQLNDRHVQLGVAPTGVYRNVGSYSAAMNGTYDANGTYSSYGSNTTAYEHYADDLCADTKKWVDNEWLDYIIPQSYWAFNHATARFADVMDWWAKVVANKNVNLYSGMGIYRPYDGWADGFEAARQLKYVAANPIIQGHCLFAYKNIRDGLSTSTGIQATNARNMLPLWNSQVLVPEIRTMTTIALPAVSHLVVSGNKLQWNLLDGAVRYAVYRSESEIINQNVDELIAVTGNKTKSYTDETAVSGKTYFYALTAISRTNTEGALKYATEGVLNAVSDLRVALVGKGHILKWSVDYPVELIKNMKIYVNEVLVKDTNYAIDEFDITDYVINGSNSVLLKVVDNLDAVIYEDSIFHNVDITVIPPISNLRVVKLEEDYKLLWGNNLPNDMDSLEITVNNNHKFVSSEIVSEYLLNYYLKPGRNTVSLKAYKNGAVVYNRSVTCETENLTHIAISDLDVEEVEGEYLLVWNVGCPTDLIKEISIYVNEELVKTLSTVVSEYDVSTYLVDLDNTVTLKVTDYHGNAIYDDYTLFYKTVKSTIPETPAQGPGEGCSLSLINMVFVFIGFGAILLKRKESI